MRVGLMCVLLLALGCQEEPEIRSYQVPRVDKGPPSWRLLGAIVPRAEQVWFFRLEGPDLHIAALKEAFDHYIQSIRFHDDAKEPVTWTLPDGWVQEPGDEKFRYATIRIESKGKHLELSVIPLPREKEADSILRNVIRWRDQLGLDPIRETELGQNAKEIQVNGVPVTAIDMSGYKMARRRPPVAANMGPGPIAPAAQPPLTYKIPEGWKEIPATGMRTAAFVVGDAKVTIIPLVRSGLLANVNRWRDEVGLEHTTEAQLGREVQTIPVDGAPAHYVDLTGPRLRILAVMRIRGEKAWFFKMIGPVDFVGNQKLAFEAFVKSVQFEAGK